MNSLVFAFAFAFSVSLAIPFQAAQAGQDPDLKPLEAFAKKVQILVEKNDSDGFGKCVDGKAVAERAIRNLPIPPDARPGILSGAKDGLSRFPKQLCQTVQQDGSYKLLRVRLVHGEKRALFRLITESGLNYHDLVLEDHPDGSLRIVDIYVAISGEFLSQTVGRLLALGLADNPKLTAKNKGADEFLTDLVKLQRITTHAREKRYREALKESDALPVSLRKEKTVQLLRVTSAAGLMEEDPHGYEKAMDDFQKAFPDDPALDLVTLDGLLLKKKYAAAYKALDRIDRNVKGDPYLHVLRANILFLEDKIGESKKAAERCVALEPKLIDPHWTLVTISLRTKDFQETKKLLLHIERQFRVEITDLRDVKDYAEFVQSPVYKEWQAARKAK